MRRELRGIISAINRGYWVKFGIKKGSWIELKNKLVEFEGMEISQVG